MTKVMIADDHEVVRKGLKTILQETNDLTVVAEVSNGNEVLTKLQEIEIDVLVMDFDMPEKNGLDTLKEVKILYPKLPVIILSIFSEEHFGTRFLKAGAAGYLRKSTASNLLVEAIRKVSKGGNYISPTLADKLVAGLNVDQTKDAHESLSDREFQVFRLLASGKKLKDIGEELCLSVHTISTYRSRILKKMDLNNNADLVTYAIQNKIIS